ncbi:DUF2730 family protein [Variovorax sp. VNK109]|uniref:DUF2730 family protein n=1 Tax=Variovorax sp. VNK109 TaxID=3400919 RepID=UPI003C0845A2
MEFDYRAAGFWFGVLQWVTQGLVVVWVYLRTKDKDNQKAVEALQTTLSAFIKAAGEANEAQNVRLTTLEEKVTHMPTDEEIAHLTGDVSTVKAQVNGIAALLTRVEHQTQLIHQHLLNRAK